MPSARADPAAFSTACSPRALVGATACAHDGQQAIDRGRPIVSAPRPAPSDDRRSGRRCRPTGRADCSVAALRRSPGPGDGNTRAAVADIDRPADGRGGLRPRDWAGCGRGSPTARLQSSIVQASVVATALRQSRPPCVIAFQPCRFRMHGQRRSHRPRDFSSGSALRRAGYVVSFATKLSSSSMASLLVATATAPSCGSRTRAYQTPQPPRQADPPPRFGAAPAGAGASANRRSRMWC